MSSEVIVALRGVGKCYVVFHNSADRLKQIFAGGRKKYYSEYWAVRGASLEVRRGERLAIVGRNGAGKSTLLQIVCGTLTQTVGELKVKGRIAALLELGAGFNPEFTGRENVYLSASILGFSGKQIEARYKDIVDFADIGEFLDQPVKTYSTGMYARLAFAIAIHVDPDVLVVDEALSVGDEAFQRKCYARIQKMCEEGVTLLFVSHSANAVVELCDRALLMDQGEIILAGQPKVVIAAYQRLAFASKAHLPAVRAEIKAGTAPEVDRSTASAARSVPRTERHAPDRAYFDPSLKPADTVEYQRLGCCISNVRVEDLHGNRVNVLVSGETYRYRYQVAFEQPARHVRFGMMIKTTTGVELAGVISHAEGSGIDRVDGGENLDVSLPFVARLNPGNYFINAGVTGGIAGADDGYLHRILDALMIRIPPRKDLQTSGYMDLAADQATAVTWNPAEPPRSPHTFPSPASAPDSEAQVSP